MAENLEIFFSNHLEELYQQLKTDLFGHTNPFARRLVVVYGPAVKSWLMLKMAQDSELNIAMGIEFIYLNQAFEQLLKLSSNKKLGHFPTLLELALAIEKELLTIIQQFKNLAVDEQTDWEPLIHYLKLHPHFLEPQSCLSRKTEKRLISLSQHLARLFQNYGRFAFQMVSRWELPGLVDGNHAYGVYYLQEKWGGYIPRERSSAKRILELLLIFIFFLLAL